MGAGLINCLKVHVTLISNEFIDRYMAAANGEYVKVYLYLMRHEKETIQTAEIADALDCTEADIRRALSYWERQGVICAGENTDDGEKRRDTGHPASLPAGTKTAERKSGVGELAVTGDLAEYIPRAADLISGESSGPTTGETGRHANVRELPEADKNGAERMERLSRDEDFSTLLYVAQQYLGKTFTSIECEKFAYLYDGLHMPGELLEFLAEYCAQIGKTSIRYIEKVALNWYQTGITTKAQAEDYTLKFSKNVSSVMKAFGLTGRNPGTLEQDFLKKWFYTYGFDRILVIEACNRTLKATQTPSFPYADKILSEWRNSGVKTMKDVEELDKNRRASKSQVRERQGAPSKRPVSTNRFNNFEGRSYDYESIVWDEIRKRQKGGGDHGAQ